MVLLVLSLFKNQLRDYQQELVTVKVQELVKRLLERGEQVSQAKVSGAAEDASDKVRTLLADYGRGYEYDRYNGFIRRVADGLTDMNILKKMIIFAAEN